MKLTFNLIVFLISVFFINGYVYALSEDDVPEGFADLATSFQSEVSVYYQGQFVGDFSADYKDDLLTFTNPEKIIKVLDFFKNTTLIEKILSQPLASNQALICADKEVIPVCKKPETKIVSIVFNPDLFRADLFVNNDYVNAKKHKYLIDKPDNQLAWLNGFNLVASGSIDEPQGSLYTITNGGVLNYGLINLNYQLLTRITDFRSQDQTITHQFQNLDLSYYYDRYRINVGFLNSIGNYFVSNQYFFGMQIQTDRHLLDSKYTGKYGSKLEVFLDEPSQVKVLYNGRVMSSQNYEAGLQNLDTGSLPQGAYNLTIQIVDYLGNSKEFNRFFVKYSLLPMADFPEYYLNTGYITSFMNNDDLLPFIGKKMLVNFGTSRRISDFWGMTGSFLQISRFTYLDTGLYAKYDTLYLEPSFLLGFQNDYGVAIAVNDVFNEYVNMNLVARSIWGASSEELNDLEYDQFVANAISINASLGLNYGSQSLSLSTQLGKNDGEPLGYSLIAAYRYNLYKSDQDTVTVGASINKSVNDYAVNLSINFGFNVSDWGIESQSMGLYKKSKGWYDYNTQLSAAHQVSDDDSSKAMRISVNKDSKAYGMGGQFKYTNDFVSVDSSANYTEGVGALFNLNVSSSIGLVFSPFNFGFANIPQMSPPYSAVLVRAQGDKDMNLTVYDEKTQIGTLSASNSSELIQLQPFQIHSISIRSIANSGYIFKETPYKSMYYPGNIHSYVWHLSALITAMMHVEDSKGKALEGLVFNYNNAIYETDEDGNMLIEYPETYQKITLNKAGEPYCQIKIRKHQDKSEGDMMLKDLGTQICIPLQKS